ncbi:3-oxo-5-alpha-steroid 4-dehydrogenase-domain-containing protein [Fomitopsis serialis]|uniref:3-oxo-5-alpha-steroid 4-dehydrogenase-domain-containing protein n=1 Tax=Fomitopsis serialis TaxID=139415 RepID=UPI0020084BFA|nr:3-oxo-5-alpha-steroid 4-dehydrogenase-domain-containing protein [Neoantrodia serialis]KAH9917846.1 3-oxo-5-alpha-steroid 4-dehydrogenase-domain-containing protein [Neoantrodia serialis]
MVSVTVSAAGRAPLARELPVTLSFDDKTLEDVTVADVKSAIAAKFSKFYTSRQKLSLKGEKTALADENGDELAVKDLGPQLGWRTVFLIEYVGPLLIHPIFYHYPAVYGGPRVPHSRLQETVYVMTMLHFIKREWETVFVHRFSHGTMPFRNIFRNSAHYWLLSGFLLATVVYSPAYSAYSPYIVGTAREKPKFLLGCVALWSVSPFPVARARCRTNEYRSSRSSGDTIRYGFSLVSFPNYFFEILSWVAIAIMTGSYAAWLFVAISAFTMSTWAIKKHKAYKREFGDAYPRNRKAIIPFIL